MQSRALWAKAISGGCVAVVSLASFGVFSPDASASTITQTSQLTGTTDVVGSQTYSTTLAAAGDTNTVTFTIGSAPQGWTIVNGNELTNTGDAPLAASGTPYQFSGSDSDTGSGAGTWSFALTVNADTIVQGSPNSDSTDVAGSSAFTSTLAAESGFVAPVTFIVTSPATGWTVTNNDVLTSEGQLAVSGSPYTISGTDSDAYGDTGQWSYLLTVTPDTIVQGSPTTGSTTTSNSTSFSDTLTATSGFDGPVTFLTSTPGFTINSGDELQTTGALSVSGSPYTVTGTDSDTFGDHGTWTYSLTVAPSVSRTPITQSSPTAGTVTSTLSGSYTAGPITVEDNAGQVTFVTTKPSQDLTVSSSGLISTTGPLTAGTYTVSGTDSDLAGDSGTWMYSLTVSAVVVTVTFEANGGTGVMASQSESAPTALTLNHFKWSVHTFVDWNTAANGSGVSYANGAVFPFGAAMTLFAQWKSGKVPSHTIVFNANGGSGSMVSETDNTPTAISPNHFTRAGYTFEDWNTAANDSGESLQAGATYPFKQSIALYAQWKKIPKPPAVHEVTYLANGGTGAMAAEHHIGKETLTLNHFARVGYTFVDWNSVANGSGTAYANGAVFSFSTSTKLYAQWKKNKVVPPPSVPSGANIGPFALTVSTLSSSLKSQIQNLADRVKTKADVQITLTGYGDSLTGADLQNSTDLAVNLELGRMRAQAVATYLEGRLSALGRTGWTISIAASGAGTSNLCGYVAGTLTS